MTAAAVKEGRSLGRLPGTDFDRVFKQGRRISRPEAVLIVSDPAAAHSSVRLGIVVGRKIMKEAVGRNRIRRILRESFRLQVRDLNPPPRDCILLVRPPARALKGRMDADAVVHKLLKKI